MNINRRKFIAQSSLFSTFAISGTKSSGKIIGANDRINVAVCGIKGRGTSHMGGHGRQKNVVISHLVDPDSRLHDARKKFIISKFKNSPSCVQDVRNVLDNKDVDVISIATPNHWHSLMSIWACQAGKDVYVEKPLSHNLFEGKKLVEAAKKYNRIVQHGTQNRSLSKWSNLANEIASGKKGRLEVALGTCHKRRNSIGHKGTKNPPTELDFDLWTGPAPKEKYHENLVHYNWHWFWNYGNGDIGNQGVHQIDIARWMIPGAVWPKKVFCVGEDLATKIRERPPIPNWLFLITVNPCLSLMSVDLLENPIWEFQTMCISAKMKFRKTPAVMGSKESKTHWPSGEKWISSKISSRQFEAEKKRISTLMSLKVMFQAGSVIWQTFLID